MGVSNATNQLVMLCAVSALIVSGSEVSAERVFLAAALFSNASLLLTLFFPVALSSVFELKVVIRRLSVSPAGHFPSGQILFLVGDIHVG